ncbi:hypothetical protein A2U01_0087727, partial [Trifolium medium]|nr:hypothetical protein [Trifolium medium]
MMATNQASFEKSKAQGGNFENACDVEEQLVKIGMKQHAMVGQEEPEKEDNGIREPEMDLYRTPEPQP